MSEAISVGDRVGVLSHTTEDTLFIYGYGIYTGITEVLEESGSYKTAGCVELDTGPLVYTHEGFVMAEDELLELQKEYENLQPIDIQKERIEKAGLKIDPQ